MERILGIYDFNEACALLSKKWTTIFPDGTVSLAGQRYILTPILQQLLLNDLQMKAMASLIKLMERE